MLIVTTNSLSLERGEERQKVEGTGKYPSLSRFF